MTSGGNTVRGLVIGGFLGDGMLVDGSGATGNLVTGNFIGTDVTGTTRLPNRFAGVRLGGSSNTVSSNLISGNTSEGVFVIGRGDQVLDNRIGTDAAGTTALGNGLSGITILQAANVLVRGNTISGNGIGQVGGGGIILSSASSDLIVGNFIGTDSAGIRRISQCQRRRLPFLGSFRQYSRRDGRRCTNVLSGNGGNGLTIRGHRGSVHRQCHRYRRRGTGLCRMSATAYP